MYYWLELYLYSSKVIEPIENTRNCFTKELRRPLIFEAAQFFNIFIVDIVLRAII